MADARLTRREVECAMLWRLSRNHGWAGWTALEDLVRAVPSHDRGRARSVAESLRVEPYIVYHPNRGFKIAHEAIDTLATVLRDECGVDEFRIEATLSHFRGFD